MAQRMDLYMGNLALFQQACVSTLYSPWLHTFFCTGEDKKSAIFFQRCCKCQKSVRKRDCTDRRGSFGCADIQVCAGTLFFSVCYEHIQVFYTRNSTADVKSALIKIHILPFKPAQLCFCQYKSKKNLLLIRKKHHCFHPVMLLRTILFRLCFFFFVENVIHLPAYLHTTWFINKDFLNNL